MSTIRALKGAFNGRLSLWARPSPHIAFRPHVSPHQPLSCPRFYSDEQSREWNSLEEFFNDQIRKPSSPGNGESSKQTKEGKPKAQVKRNRSKQTKEARSTKSTDFDDEEDELSRILSPKQEKPEQEEKPKKPWLKKREENIARSKASSKIEARRERKIARNIAILEQETRMRHAAGRPDITSATDPEKSELTPRTAQEAIARWQEMKEKDARFGQIKDSRAVRALKRDARRQAKEARIFMASQAAEKAWEHEFEQIEHEKKHEMEQIEKENKQEIDRQGVTESRAKERFEKVKAAKEVLREARMNDLRAQHASTNNTTEISQSPVDSVSEEPVAEEVSFTPQQQQESPVSRNARAVINEGQSEVSEHVAQPRNNTTALPRREVPAPAQQNAVQTPADPQQHNDSPKETAAENPDEEDEWKEDEDEMDDDDGGDDADRRNGGSKKKVKPTKKERRRLKLLMRFKEKLQIKAGIPVGDTKPHPKIDAQCEAWMRERILAEQSRERRKKDRKVKKAPYTFDRKGRNN
ncbi:hypothetical protein QBC45DRAFT_144347 [Copromyces sp. CBS 386.78]|nr:hypothetical protein QBC45DRAFT_144347 [Copromyces sp. CBS 386.78]